MKLTPDKTVPDDFIAQMTRRELIDLYKAEAHVRLLMEEQLIRLKKINDRLESGITRIGGVLVKFQNRLFNKSSERFKPAHPKGGKKDKKRKPKANTTKLPSEKYPEAPIIERDIDFKDTPSCDGCGCEMKKSTMATISEYLNVVPKVYSIIRQSRHKYRCPKCHGSVKTAPSFQRIRPGSAYSDEMIIDVAMSKYCDLIPIERLCTMAAREGFPGLPANSLIELTHYLADFVTTAVERVLSEILAATILHADETTHRMLEGDLKSNWYLWGFSSEHAAYFECHDTRSGDVASDLLKDSQCEILMSDVYSGYPKAVRVINKARKEADRDPVKSAFCNAHARRKFKECEGSFKEESSFFLRTYRIIYRLESWGRRSGRLSRNRRRMVWIFEKMRAAAIQGLNEVSEKSELAKAIKYFLNNFDELTLFTRDERIPIDNNSQERLLRSPVIGRKTWYGTHSKRGAETAAKMFTLVESCKINNINPRDYMKALVKDLLAGRPAFTPKEFKEREKT